MNVCFRQKPPGGFRDQASTPLMTATGWLGEWRFTCHAADVWPHPLGLSLCGVAEHCPTSTPLTS